MEAFKIELSQVHLDAIRRAVPLPSEVFYQVAANARAWADPISADWKQRQSRAIKIEPKALLALELLDLLHTFESQQRRLGLAIRDVHSTGEMPSSYKGERETFSRQLRATDEVRAAAERMAISFARLCHCVVQIRLNWEILPAAEIGRKMRSAQREGARCGAEAKRAMGQATVEWVKSKVEKGLAHRSRRTSGAELARRLAKLPDCPVSEERLRKIISQVRARSQDSKP